MRPVGSPETSCETEVVTVCYLADVPQALPVLARWYVAEWGPYYGPDGPGDAESDLKQATNRNRLPLSLVALDAVGEPVGTVSLREESVPSHRHLKPWVTALLVIPGRRGQGIGTKLLAAAEEEARRLEYQRLYIATDVAIGLFERRGWRSFDEAPTLRGTVKVFSLDLQRSASVATTKLGE